MRGTWAANGSGLAAAHQSLIAHLRHRRSEYRPPFWKNWLPGLTKSVSSLDSLPPHLVLVVSRAHDEICNHDSLSLLPVGIAVEQPVKFVSVQ